MHDAQTLDAEITRMYTTGESTMAISKRLGLRPAEVISRVRALNLVPPGMGYRRPTPEAASPREADDAAEAAASRRDPCAEEAEAPRPIPLRPARRPAPPAPAAVRPRRAHRAQPLRSGLAAALVLEDEDADECDDLATLPGRPRGWLVTEGELAAIFSHHRGRFEDVRLRSKQGR
jgi:hypothetical protein